MGFLHNPCSISAHCACRNTSITRSESHRKQQILIARTPPAMQHTRVRCDIRRSKTPRIGETDPWCAENGANTWAFYIICLPTPSQSFTTQLQRPIWSCEAYRPFKTEHKFVLKSCSSQVPTRAPSRLHALESILALPSPPTSQGRNDSSTRNLASAIRAHDPALLLTRSARASTRSTPRACRLARFRFADQKPKKTATPLR